MATDEESDDGVTVLPSMGVVSKAHPRVAVDGSVDELNTLIGAARPTGIDGVDGRLCTIQHHLHVLHADVTNPDPPEWYPAVAAEHIAALEHWIDCYPGVRVGLSRNRRPGGTDAGSQLYRARTVCQRAERRAVELAGREQINEHIPTYLNRLADVLFVFARVVNERADPL